MTFFADRSLNAYDHLRTFYSKVVRLRSDSTTCFKNVIFNLGTYALHKAYVKNTSKSTSGTNVHDNCILQSCEEVLSRTYFSFDEGRPYTVHTCIPIYIYILMCRGRNLNAKGLQLYVVPGNGYRASITGTFYDHGLKRF